MGTVGVPGLLVAGEGRSFEQNHLHHRNGSGRHCPFRHVYMPPSSHHHDAVRDRPNRVAVNAAVAWRSRSDW